MNDRPNEHDGPVTEPDPALTFALRSMEPPQHGYGFWDQLDARLSAESPAATSSTVILEPEPPAPPPLAEVVPIHPAPRARPPAWWLAGVAALLVVAVAAAMLVRTVDSDVETTPAATVAPVETTAPPTTAAPAPTTVPPPTTVVPGVVPTTAVPRPTTTTTTRPAGLTLSPDGLGALRLGMTPEQAEATGVVGPFEDPLGTGGTCGFAKPAGTYRVGDFSALFTEQRLARIYVEKGSRLRTPQGIGVGSPKSKLSAVPGTRVESPHPYGAGTNVDIMNGNVGYQFTVDQGVVTAWSVGDAEGLSLPEGCA